MSGIGRSSRSTLGCAGDRFRRNWVGDGRSGGGQREGGRDAREHGTEAKLDDALSRDDLYPDHVLIRLHTLSVEDPGDDALHPWLPQT